MIQILYLTALIIFLAHNTESHDLDAILAEGLTLNDMVLSMPGLTEFGMTVSDHSEVLNLKTFHACSTTVIVPHHLNFPA